MTLMFTPERRVPRDHLGFLIARHGWWRVAAGLIVETFRPTTQVRGPRFSARPATKGRLPARVPGGWPLPASDHLRRDIGLPPAGDGSGFGPRI